MVRTVIGLDTYASARAIYWLARGRELRAPYTLRHKLHAWRRGFRAESALVFGFPRPDWREFVSDYGREQRFGTINAARALFNQKPVMRAFLLGHGFPQAETIALLGRGEIRMHPFTDASRAVEPAELARWLAEDGGSFMFKPQDGQSGRGILLLDVRDDVLVRRRGMDVEPFPASHFRSWGSPIVLERRLEQGAFFRELHPESANSMRVMTLWTPGDAAPFVARAVQRAGTRDTVPTDNFSGGGISALIDLESGRLGIGRLHPVLGRLAEERWSRHPDSGAQIEGVVVPYWDQVRETVLRAAALLPTNPYIGWDVLVDDAGTPLIIEANGNMAFGAVQVHGGLLAAPAIRRFYETLGMI